MSKKNFKPGDMVRLKSGSPKLTVDSVLTEQSIVRCVWFVDGVVAQHDFQETSLEPAEGRG